jgi:hypothetical protein
VNVLFASALLSELVDNKTLKLSNTKIGGSPVYYVSGQEEKLQVLRDKLNDKQQRAFDMLKQAKIMRDTELEPVIRVSLRDIKDFAKPLNVTWNGLTELFWKWYLTPDIEAEGIIKEKLSKLQVVEKKELPKPQDVQQQLSQIERDLKKLEEERAKPIERVVKEEIVRKEVVEAKKIEEEKPKKQRKVKEVTEHPVQQELEQKQEIFADNSDAFMVKSFEFFKQNKIEVNELKQIKKNNEFEGVVTIPNVIGKSTYFCKAKNKQKISDADLSLLYVQSQMKKMPVLLITTGEVSKKAQDLLDKEFKNITIKKI